MTITPEKLRRLAKMAPVFAAEFNAAADEIERLSAPKCMKKLTVEVDFDFLGKNVPDLINEIKASAICELIDQESSVARMHNDSKRSLIFVADAKEFLRKLEQGEIK